MTWATPKTDWATDDVISTTDLNRIEENISHLFADNSTNIASTGNLNIGNSEFLKLTGVNTVNYISTTGRAKGSRITCECDGVIFAHLEGSPPANHAELYINRPGVGPGDAQVGSGAGTLGTISFVYNGTYWICTGFQS
jgi:hypothetical protein